MGLGSGGGLSKTFLHFGASPRVGSCVATYFWEDQLPFFAVHTFKFKPIFLAFFPFPLGNPAPGDLCCHTQSNCSSFSDITLLHWQTTQQSLVRDLHHWLCLSFPHPPQQRTQPPYPHQVLGLSLPQFHDFLLLQIELWRCSYPSTCWMDIDSLWVRTHYIWTPGNRGLGEQGVSGFCPSFQLLGCEEQFRIGDRIFTVELVG